MRFWSFKVKVLKVAVGLRRCVVLKIMGLVFLVPVGVVENSRRPRFGCRYELTQLAKQEHINAQEHTYDCFPP